MSSRFDCAICVNSCPVSKHLRCPGCDFEVCAKCQQTYGEPVCMNCQVSFTRGFLLKHLGKSFVETKLRKQVTEQLLVREKALLPQTQPFVEYERARKAELARARFGFRPRIPAIPVLNTADNNANVVFPCPAADCRGFVTTGNCGTCAAKVCLACRELIEDGHVCDVAALASVAAMTADTKPCPKCGVPIFRSSGCNHMRCTKCWSHFDWHTGRILANSSNHHYDNLANAAARHRDAAENPGSPGNPETPAAEAPACTDDDVVTGDAVPRADQTHVSDEELLRSLYDDAEVVRCTKATLYSERDSALKYNRKLVQMRVDYLLGTLEESKWATRLFQLEQQTEKDAHVSRVINLYLATVRQFQIRLRSRRHTDDLRSEWVAFLDLCNDSFHSLNVEHGCLPYKIRTNLKDIDAPVFAS